MAELKEIVSWKIPALGGRDAETNLMVLELLALEGPQTAWKTNSMLGRNRKQYPTIFRAIVRLRKWGYLAKTGTVKMEKKKGRTPTFGVSWRGLLASLASDKVCTNILDVLNKNDQLDLPIPRDVFLDLAKALWSSEQIQEITMSLFESLVNTIPHDIESTPDEVLLGYLVPALIDAAPVLENIMPKETTELLKYPKLQDWFEELIAKEAARLQRDLTRIEEAKRWLSDLRSQGKPEVGSA